MRIISGSARGRSIYAPKGLSTRPTTDRVKESLFGILQFRIAGAAVLDLFSGSGGLGLESLSRGAKSAVFNDADRESVRVIKSNLQMLGFEDRATVFNLNADACLKLLAQKEQKFDLIFLDPPYDKGLEIEAVERIDTLGLLSPGGRIVIEHAAKTRVELPSAVGKLLFVADTRKYGDTSISFLEEIKP